ncbi:MAG: glycoside hydrolase family 38 C-terminal domain-containing protein [Microthrixaceae bacterium]
MDRIHGAVELQPHAAAEVLESGPLVGRLRTEHRFGESTVRRTITLRAGSPRLDVTLDIDWQEDEKLLSIEFPLDVRSDRASCEAQFGYLRRPTHRSTSWDAAKFEVCAHRWVDLSEPGFGVAVLNDGRYGHGVQDGGIRVSLLRAPRYPDPTADRGRHRVTVSLLPHGAGLADVMTSAEALNTPLRVVDRGAEVVDTPVPVPLVSLSDPRVAVSAVKRAHDGSGDLIVRLWEATGDRVELGVTTSGTLTGVERCDLMEERLDGPEIRPDGDGGFALVLRPFELVSLRLQTMSG